MQWRAISRQRHQVGEVGSGEVTIRYRHLLGLPRGEGLALEGQVLQGGGEEGSSRLSKSRSMSGGGDGPARDGQFSHRG